MITLEEKLLQGYKHKYLSFDKNEHKCEEVKALNPRLQVRYRPVLFMISYDCCVCSFTSATAQLPNFSFNTAFFYFLFAASSFQARRHRRERVVCRVSVSGGKALKGRVS